MIWLRPKSVCRQPLAFTELQWLPADAVGDEVPGLFPKEREELTAQEMHDIEWAVKQWSPEQ